MRNRSSLYAVIRKLSADQEHLYDAQIVGVYSTLESADAMAGMYNQQVLEGKLPDNFEFETQITTYYDE